MPEGGLVEGWALYSEVQCIMGNGHMGPYGQTDTCENITFIQFRQWEVKIEALVVV